MNNMSGMMNKDMAMDAGTQKKMGQMRKQMDQMRKGATARRKSEGARQGVFSSPRLLCRATRREGLAFRHDSARAHGAGGPVVGKVRVGLPVAADHVARRWALSRMRAAQQVRFYSKINDTRSISRGRR